MGHHFSSLASVALAAALMGAPVTAQTTTPVPGTEQQIPVTPETAAQSAADPPCRSLRCDQRCGPLSA